MKLRTIALGLALGLAAPVAGCGGAAPTLQTAPRKIAALSVFVSPNVKLTGAHADDHKGFEQSLADAVQAGFVKAGVGIAENANKPHDLDCTLTADFAVEKSKYWSQNGKPMESEKLVVRMKITAPDGTLIDSVDGTADPNAADAPDQIATLVVNATLGSRRVVAFADNPRDPKASRLAALEPEAPAADEDDDAPKSQGKGKRARSDDDGDAPRAALVAASPQPTAYALVVGIEKYRDVGVPAVGAHSDAVRMQALFAKTLGVPPEHVKVALDDRATKGDIEKHLQWLKANVPAGGRIYFYFSGHGAPEPSSGTSYILPYEGDPKFLDRTAIPMSSVMKALGETKAKDVLAIVDACFSGAGGRSVLPPGARPLVRVKETTTAPARVALLSAASGSEISGPAPNGDGGLFTSKVADALGSGRGDVDGDGQVSLEELFRYVKPRVARAAMRDNREQTPQLTVGGNVNASSFIVAWGLPGAK